MKKLFLVLICVFICFSLCGCYDLIDVADMAYIIAVGIDYSKPNECDYTFQFANSDMSEKPKMYTAKADNLYTAMNYINGIFAQEYDFSQLRIVVLSDELNDTEFIRQLNFFTDNPHIHPDVTVGLSKGSANEFLKNMGKGLDVFPTSYYEKVFNMEYTVFAPKTTIHDIEAYEYYALPLIGGSISGMAVCSKKGVLGKLNGEEARIYNLIKEGVANLKYNMNINGEEVVFSVSSHKPQKRVYLKNGTEIVINSEFYCENLWNGDKVNEDEVEKYIKNKMSGLLKKCSRNYKADIFNFSDEAKKNYLTNKDWQNEDWDGLFKNADFDINVKINIIRE